jgi:hypothetical protein
VVRARWKIRLGEQRGLQDVLLQLAVCTGGGTVQGDRIIALCACQETPARFRQEGTDMIEAARTKEDCARPIEGDAGTRTLQVDA